MDLYKNKDIFKSKIKCLKKKENPQLQKETHIDNILDNQFLKTYYENKLN